MSDITRPELFDEGALIRELIDRGGLAEFIKTFWAEAYPDRLSWNWHIDAMCEYLQAVTIGQIKRLVINVPPGHMKSATVGVFWPAWMWTLDPTLQILAGSFDQTLLNNQSEKVIHILGSDRYQGAYGEWVELASKTPALREFKTTKGGFRFNTSPEGKGTGRHVDGIIIDDPIKPQDAILGREAAFKKVDSWFDGTLQTRVRKWIVVIMQRVHTDDLAGRCIREGYESLILPARQTKRPMWARDPRKEIGELLWPELFPEERVRSQEIKLDLQGRQASAQLQQDPTPSSGGFVEEAWTRREWITLPEDLGRLLRFVQSWDFSSKGIEESHSKVAGNLWCRAVLKKPLDIREYISSLEERLANVKGAHQDFRIVTLPPGSELFFLVDWVGGHWNFVTSKTQFAQAQTIPGWRMARRKLIELKANGPALIEDMKQIVPGIVGVEPDGSKEERYHVHTEKWQLGQVLYPPGKPAKVDGHLYNLGADYVRSEHIKFPRYSYDDNVDTATQALDDLDNSTSRFRENLAKIARGT